MFAHSCVNSHNVLVRTCIMHAMNGSNSVTCKNLLHIRHKVNALSVKQLIDTGIQYSKTNDIILCSKAGAIRDILFLKSGNDSDITTEQLNFMLDTLCTL